MNAAYRPRLGHPFLRYLADTNTAFSLLLHRRLVCRAIRGLWSCLRPARSAIYLECGSTECVVPVIFILRGVGVDLQVYTAVYVASVSFAAALLPAAIVEVSCLLLVGGKRETVWKLTQDSQSVRLKIDAIA